MGSGGTPLTSKREYYAGGTIPWLQSGEVAQGEVRTANNFITQAGFENSAARIFPRDTVLVAMYGATAGQVGILRFEASTNQAICGIFPNEKFRPKFLYYALLSKKNELISRAVGNAQPNISQVKIKNTYVPVPPLVEQKRIVAILDEAFEGIDTAIANAEKNLANARELFDSFLQTMFACPAIGWKKKPLATVCKKITVGHVGSMAQRYQASGIPFLRSQNVRPFEITMDNVTFIDDAFHAELNKSQLRPGDLAIVRTGYPGTAAVVPSWLIESNCSDLVIFRCGEELMPEYLEAFFNSSFGKKLVLGKLVGAAQKHFNVTAAKEVVLHYPLAHEQAKIVAEIKQLRDETKRLETLYKDKIAALAKLKQAILAKAFTGNLVATPKREC
jgi:type I restriction enzyme S subunit